MQRAYVHSKDICQRYITTTHLEKDKHFQMFPIIFFSALVLYRYFPGMFLSHPLQFFSPYSLLLCPSLKLCSILISSQFSSASESQCCTLCLLFCGTYSGTQGLSPCLYQAPLCFSAFDLQLLSTLQCFSWDLFGLSTFVKATTKKH